MPFSCVRASLTPTRPGGASTAGESPEGLGSPWGGGDGQGAEVGGAVCRLVRRMTQEG